MPTAATSSAPPFPTTRPQTRMLWRGRWNATHRTGVRAMSPASSRGAAGHTLHPKVVGLARAAIGPITLPGALQAPAGVKAAPKDRIR